jgi:hypothetical protein
MASNAMAALHLKVRSLLSPSLHDTIWMIQTRTLTSDTQAASANSAAVRAAISSELPCTSYSPGPGCNLGSHGSNATTTDCHQPMAVAEPQTLQ